MRGRYHYLDAARGILMILGIVYHAARVYGDAGWLVSNGTTNPAFDVLAIALHSFRMPAFFLMSGFFAGMTLTKHGPGEFLRLRSARIVVPFLTSLLTLNVAQLYLLRAYRGGSTGGLDAIFTGALWAGQPIDAWISHLWFLVCLAYYFLAAALGIRLLGARGLAAIAAIGRATGLASRPALCLLLLPFGNLGVLVLFSLAPDLYRLRPLINLDTVALYVPFFAAGLAAFASRGLYESLTRFAPRMLAVSLVAAALVGLHGWLEQGGALPRLAAAYGVFLGNWVAVYWVLVGVRALLDRPSAIATGLADAAYTIYLFHHLTILGLGWWLRGVDLSLWVEFPLLVAATFLFTLALHRLVIRRVSLLLFLFNGRTYTRDIRSVVTARAGAA